jgi:hypothetical protein
VIEAKECGRSSGNLIGRMERKWYDRSSLEASGPNYMCLVRPQTESQNLVQERQGYVCGLSHVRVYYVHRIKYPMTSWCQAGSDEFSRNGTSFVSRTQILTGSRRRSFELGQQYRAGHAMRKAKKSSILSKKPRPWICLCRRT